MSNRKDLIRMKWREANIKYGDTKGFINLKSWLRGCRHDQSLDKTT